MKPTPTSEQKKINIAKLVATLIFTIYFIRAIFSPTEYLRIYMVDFVFHEAGHLVFGIFGNFMKNIGGTLMQLLIPTVVAFHFFKQKQFHSVSMVLLWIGENWINISVYASDARARLLPLHGGESVTHDWSEILLTLGMLHYDQGIARLFYSLGVIFMLAGLGLGIYFSFNQRYLRHRLPE